MIAYVLETISPKGFYIDVDRAPVADIREAEIFASATAAAFASTECHLPTRWTVINEGGRKNRRAAETQTK